MYLTLEEARQIDDKLTLEHVEIASKVIDQYCGRTFSITENIERIDLTRGSRRLSHTPVVRLISVSGLIRNYSLFQHFGESWVDVNIADVGVDSRGEIYMPNTIFNTSYDAAEVTYLSGYTDIPDKIRQACGTIAKQLIGTNTATLQAYRLSSLITPEVADLLSAYRVERR